MTTPITKTYPWGQYLPGVLFMQAVSFIRETSLPLTPSRGKKTSPKTTPTTITTRNTRFTISPLCSHERAQPDSCRGDKNSCDKSIVDCTLLDTTHSASEITWTNQIHNGIIDIICHIHSLQKSDWSMWSWWLNLIVSSNLQSTVACMHTHTQWNIQVARLLISWLA